MPDREEKKEPIKVTDRRSFTLEGERRVPEGQSAQEEGPRPEDPQKVKGAGFEMRRTPPDAAPKQGPLQAVDFNSFILSLASTAFIHLGEMEDPVTRTVQVQLEAARQMIDIIDMLHAKTRGNLSPQEEEFISGVLYELKMRFSQKAGVR